MEYLSAAEIKTPINGNGEEPRVIQTEAEIIAREARYVEETMVNNSGATS